MAREFKVHKITRHTILTLLLHFLHFCISVASARRWSHVTGWVADHKARPRAAGVDQAGYTSEEGSGGTRTVEELRGGHVGG